MKNTLIKDFTEISYFSYVKITRSNLLKAMKNAAKLYSKGKLIDLGCGFKPYESVFEPYTTSYFGVDFPTTAEVNYGERTKADLLADCTDTQLAGETYDTLLSNQVMEHIYDTKKFLNECYRLLKKDGKAIFTVPLLWELHAEPYDFFRFTKHALRNSFEEAGFSIVEITPLEGAFAALIQTQIISFYSLPFLNQQSIFTKIAQKILQLTFFPILNFLALHLDKLFYNDRLCLNYLVVAKK
jgi:SAM-dependent methyltransferase